MKKEAKVKKAKVTVKRAEVAPVPPPVPIVDYAEKPRGWFASFKSFWR